MIIKQAQTSSVSGFSTTELLLILAVTAILSSLTFPLLSKAGMTAKRAQCVSNMRQIGAAILSYAAEHGGQLPVSSHTTGNSRRQVNGEWVYNIEKSWIYTIAGYLSDVDAIRICPADEKERQERLLALPGTSYILNDVIFDYEENRRLQRIPSPSRTPIVFISNRPVSKTWDHAHCGSWTGWAALRADVATDRHRTGSRDPQQLNGSANYLYADGHVKNLLARDMKAIVDSGQTPWIPER